MRGRRRYRPARQRIFGQEKAEERRRQRRREEEPKTRAFRPRRGPSEGEGRCLVDVVGDHLRIGHWDADALCADADSDRS